MIRLSRIEPYIIFLFVFIQISGLSILVYFIPGLGEITKMLKYLVFLIPILYLLKGFYFEWRMLFFIFICITTLFINNIDPVFKSEYRLFSWVLLIFAVGPFVFNEYLQIFREKLLNTIFYSFMIMGSLSFIWWIIGLPSLGRGHFTGLFTHSMLLAPIASIGSIFAITKVIFCDKIKLQLIFLFLFITNFLSILLAASRGALFATIFVLIVFIIFARIRYKTILILLLIVISFFSYQLTDFNLLDTDVTQNIANRGIDNTRVTLWHDRILEFNSSPIFGVGFAAQDLTLNGLLGKGASDEGGVEPGSTYLMILSMTGLIGLISLIILLSKYFFLLKEIKFSLGKPNLLIFIFFLIHFISEGYIYSSGSLMAFTFWLLVGTTYPNNYNKEYNEN